MVAVRGAPLLLSTATLLFTACSHVPLNPKAGDPVRLAIVKAKTQTEKVAEKAPEAKPEILELQQNLNAAEVAFKEFEARYEVATKIVADQDKKISDLNQVVSKVSWARNLWRAVTFTAAAAVVLCLALLIIPKLPL